MEKADWKNNPGRLSRESLRQACERMEEQGLTCSSEEMKEAGEIVAENLQRMHDNLCVGMFGKCFPPEKEKE